MLFISHSTLDKGYSVALKDHLLHLGYSDEQIFLDSEPVGGIPPGARWENVIYRSLNLCQAIVVLCSPRWNASKWCFAELAAAKMRGKLVFPLIIEECDRSALSEYQALVAEQPAEQAKAFEWLAAELERQGIGPSDIGVWPHPGLVDVEGQPDLCPFPGLSAFDARYEAVYFGRDRERDELLEQLQRMRTRGEPRLLMVTGGSGSGKSSLVKCGALPKLAHRRLSQSWLVFPTLRFGQRSTPGALFDALALEIIARHPRDPSGTAPPSHATLSQSLSNDQGASNFIQATRSLIAVSDIGDPTILLSIDQFEELLAVSSGSPQGMPEAVGGVAASRNAAGISTPLQPESAADSFLRFLRDLCSSSDTRVLVIGTMRSDYLDTYEQHRYALRAPHIATWRLEPFAREHVESVIAGPAERAGIEFAPALIERLSFDTRASEARTIDALPLLAFTLEKLFRRCAASGEIKLEDYESIGGVEGAIRQAAEEILPSKLTDVPAEIVAAVRVCFSKHLVQVNDKGEYVRRVARWDEVKADIPLHAADQTLKILERFIQARLLTKTGRASDHAKLEEAADVTLEVTHEAIFRCWAPLQLWLNESARLLRWRRDVRRDQESAALNRQTWGGLRMEQLAVSRDWPSTRRMELSAQEAIWIAQAKWRANRLKLGAAVVALSFAVLGVVAAWNAHVARQESEVARARGLAAESYRYRDSDPQLAALLAVGAADSKPTWEALGAMLRVVYGQRRPQFIEIPVSTAFAVSPTQAVIATGHADGTVQIRPIDRGAPVILKASALAVSHLAFDSTGNYLAVAHKGSLGKENDQVEVWHVTKGTRVGRSIVAGGTIQWLAVQRDGQSIATLASSLGQGLLRVWNIETGQLVAGPRPVSGNVASLNPNGDLIGVVASRERPGSEQVQYFNALDLTLAKTAVLDSDASATVAAFDRTGAWFIIGDAGGAIRFSAVPGSAPVLESELQREPQKRLADVLAGHSGSVTSLATHPDGKILASGGEDGTIRLWHLQARQPLVLPEKPHYGGGSGFEPFTGALVSSTEIFSPDPHGEPVLRSFQPRETIYAWERRAMAVGFSPDGRFILEASSTDTIQRWDLPIGKAVINYRRSPGGGDISDDASVVARAHAFSAVVLSYDGSLISTAKIDEYVGHVMLDRSGKTVAVAGSLTVQVFDARNGKAIAPPMTAGVERSLSPDGSKLAIAGADGIVRLFNAHTSALTSRSAEPILGGVNALVFAADSKTIFAGSSTGAVHKFRVSTGEELDRFQRGSNAIAVLAVDHSGRWLAVADKQGIVRIWDTRERNSVGPAIPMETTNGEILALRFSHDGSKLAVGMERLNGRLLDVQSGQQIGPDLKTLQAAEALGFTAGDEELRVVTRNLAPQTMILSADRLRPIVAALTGRNATWSEWERYFAPTLYERTFAEYGVHASYLQEARRRVLDGQMDEGKAMFQRAARLQPDLQLNVTNELDQVRLISQAEDRARRGDVEAAAADFRRALALGWQPPPNGIEPYANELAAQALTAEGVRYAENNEVDKARHSFEAALKAIGGHPSIKEDYDGRIQRELADAGAAAYARVIAFRALLEEARRLEKLGRVEEALSKWQAAAPYDPVYTAPSSALVKSRATAALKKEAGEWVARRDLDRARDLYGRARRIDPSFDADREFNRVVAGVKRGEVKWTAEAGRLAQALQLIDEAQALDPQPADAVTKAKASTIGTFHRANGDRLADRGQQQAAINEYQAAIARDPTLTLDPANETKNRRLKAIRSNAVTLLSNGDRAGALKTLQSLLQVDAGVSLEQELVILTCPSRDARDDLRSYFGKKKEKVFLLTPLGSWQWAAGWSTSESALSEAMKDVRARHGGGEAFLYLKNDTVVAPNEELAALRQMLRAGRAESP